MGLEQPRCFQAPVWGLAPGWCCLIRYVRDMPALWAAVFPPSYSRQLSPGVPGMPPGALDPTQAALPVSQSPCVALGKEVLPLQGPCTRDPPSPTAPNSGDVLGRKVGVCWHAGAEPGLADCPAPRAGAGWRPRPALSSPPSTSHACGLGRRSGGLGEWGRTDWAGSEQGLPSVFLAVPSPPWSMEKAFSTQQASCPGFKELKGRAKKGVKMVWGWEMIAVS